MSERKSKKLRQYYKRNFQEQVNAFQKIVKMRPRSMPIWLYFLLAKIFFTAEFLKAYRKEIREIERKEREFKRAEKEQQKVKQQENASHN